MTALYDLPAFVLLAGAVVVVVAWAWALQMAIHRGLPRLKFDTHNTVGGIALGIIGTLFAITLAFIVGIVWREYDDSAQRVASEAEAAGDAWHLAAGLPSPGRTELRELLRAYGKTLVTDEWPRMRRGGSSPRADALLADAFRTLNALRTTNADESNAKVQVQTQLIAMHDVRLRRFDDNRSGVAAFEWGVLLFVASMTLGTLAMLGMPDRRVHLALTAAVAAAMAALLVLIFELDYPFRGDLAVPPTAWNDFLVSTAARDAP